MNRTLSEYRAARVVELLLGGATYAEAALELGYRDRSGAWRAARRCLAKRQQIAADRYVHGSLVDAEALSERYWRSAMQGDLHAAELVLASIERKLRLLELMSTQETQQLVREHAATKDRRPSRAASRPHFREDEPLGPIRL